MRRRRAAGSRAAAAFLPPIACATAGCNGTADSFGVHPGNRIAITVVDVSETSPFITTFVWPAFDIAPGQMLIATDMANPAGNGEADTCNSAAVSIDPFAGWSWTPANRLTGTDPTVLTGSFNASNGQCAGYVTLTVTVVPGSDPFAASEADELPTWVMERDFTAQGDGGGSCPHSCMDRYSVDLKRL